MGVGDRDAGPFLAGGRAFPHRDRPTRVKERGKADHTCRSFMFADEGRPALRKRPGVRSASGVSSKMVPLRDSMESDPQQASQAERMR